MPRAGEIVYKNKIKIIAKEAEEIPLTENVLFQRQSIVFNFRSSKINAAIGEKKMLLAGFASD